MSDFIIGDIHGCAETTKRLVEDVIQPSGSDRLVFLGDYIDRGPNSKGVIDYVKELSRHADFEVVALRGNHEQMLLNALENVAEFDLWMFNHGYTTLHSYGISPYGSSIYEVLQQFPKEHEQFIRNMPFFYESPNYLAVHAGFDFDRQDYAANEFTMVWTRQMQVNPEMTNNRPVIHGHTPISLDIIQTSVDHKEWDINVDNGCKFKEMPGYGNLIAYEPVSGQIFKQPNVD